MWENPNTKTLVNNTKIRLRIKVQKLAVVL